MTPEQINAWNEVLKTTVILVGSLGGLLLAGFSLYIQGRREAQRDKRQREWEKEDRDTARTWQLKDRKIEIRKEQLLFHKHIVDEYLNTSLDFATKAALKWGGIEVVTETQLSEVQRSLLYRTSEVQHHIIAFGSRPLNEKFLSVLDLLQGSPQAKDNMTQEDINKHMYYATEFAIATAKVTNEMETILQRAIALSDELDKTNGSN